MSTPEREKRVEPDRRYERFSKTVGWVLAGLVTWSLAIGGLQLVLFDRDAERQSTLQEQQRALQGQQKAIQQQRRDSIRTSCEEQNARYRTTITRLQRLAAQAPPDGRSAAAREASLQGTIQLIDALVPVQDCDELVKERVR